MSNKNLAVMYAFFYKLTDNVVKEVRTTWRVLVDSILSHPVVTEEKESLPVFNGWAYVAKGDPAEDLGTHKDGRKVLNFSPTGVRRIQQNLVEMFMFILDFDGGMKLSEVQAIFGEYEYVCYTSFNHQVGNAEESGPAVDKMRVVLLFDRPMPVTKFQELKSAMKYWIDGGGSPIADPKTFSIGQVFLLPAVRADDQSKAIAWHNEGKLLDWTMFEIIKQSMPVQHTTQFGASGSKPSSLVLKPDDVLDTANGTIMVKDIEHKISYVLCPFHADRKPSEFASITSNGTPFLQCKRCGRIYMQRYAGDPIIEGLAKLKDMKRRRTAQEAK
jgi:hypothetical protein